MHALLGATTLNSPNKATSMQNGKWRDVRVFVSSTFRDMQAERDHLVKVVFPTLSERLEPHRVRLVDVDLRWGLTEEMVRNQQVERLCLEEIDRCQIFLALVGARYGTLCAEVGTDAGEEKSVTEAEIERGALSPAAVGRPALFYFRDPSCLDDIPEPRRSNLFVDRADRVESLKQRVRHAGHKPFVYFARWDASAENRPITLPPGRLAELEAFGEKVRDDLWAALVKLLRLGEAETPRAVADDEDDAQARFAETRLRFYVGREDVRDRLRTFLTSRGSRLCVVAGPSGSGKSAALARLAAEFAEKRSPLALTSHFIGGSARSAELREMLIRLTAALPGPAPGDLRGRSVFELATAWRERLAATPVPTLVVIDALDQLNAADRARELWWLPRRQPANVRLVVSVSTGKTGARLLSRLEERNPSTIELGPLAESDRRALVRDVPLEAAKTLEPAHVETLVANPETGNPLYLRVVLEELRGVGGPDLLGGFLSDLPKDDAAVASLFDQVLERLETDFGAPLVKDVLSLLLAARRGLSDRELRTLLVERADAEHLFPLLRQLRPYLTYRGGLRTFFHRTLREAARSRYLSEPNARSAVHQRLAAYFAEQFQRSDSQRTVRALDELFWQNRKAGDTQACDDLLADADYLVQTATAGFAHNLPGEFEAVIRSLPADDPRRDHLAAVQAAVGRHLPFIARHPEMMFSCVRNMLDRRIETTSDVGPPIWYAGGPDMFRIRVTARDAQRAEVARRVAATVPAAPPPAATTFPDAARFGKLRWNNPGYAFHEAVCPVCGRGGPAGSGNYSVELRIYLSGDPGPFDRPIEQMRIKCGDECRVGTDDVSGLYLIPQASADWNRERVENYLESIGSPYAGHPSLSRIPSRRDGESRFEARPADQRPERSKATRRKPRRADGVAASSGSLAPLWERWNAAATPGAESERPIAMLPLGYGVQDSANLVVGLGEAIAGIGLGVRGRVFAAGYDGALGCWDATTGRNLYLSKIPDTGVGFAVSPDGACLALGCHSGKVVLRDALTGEDMAHWPTHEGRACAVAFSPTGKYLATGGDDRTVRLRERASGREFAVLRGHSRGVASVAFSPDGRSLASGGGDKEVIMWNLADGRPTLVLRGHEELVACVAFSPDGRTLASASDDGTVILWSRENGQVLHAHRPERGWITALAYSPRARWLATGHQSGMVRIWDARRGTFHRSVQAHNRTVRGLAFTPDGRRIVSGGEDGMVVVHDVADARDLPIRIAHRNDVRLLRWSPDGRHVVSRCDGETTCVWDAAGGLRLRMPGRSDVSGSSSVRTDANYRLDPTGVVPLAAAWTRDGKWIAGFNPGGDVLFWTAPRERPTLKWEIQDSKDRHLTFATPTFSPDGSRLAVLGSDPSVLLVCRSPADSALGSGSPGRFSRNEMPEVVWERDFDGEQPLGFGYSGDGDVLGVAFENRVAVFGAMTGDARAEIPIDGEASDAVDDARFEIDRELGETRIQRDPVAWLPVAFDHLVESPGGDMLAGSKGSQVLLYRFDGG